MRYKIVRVVTASYVIPWHLGNTLKRISSDFDVCVVGQNVSKYAETYPRVEFVDIKINRKTSAISDVVAVFALCRFLYSYKPDIVHSIMPKAGLLTALSAFICRVPVRIHTFTGQTWMNKSGIFAYLLLLADKLINHLNTVCMTDSFSQSMFLFEKKISFLGKPLPVLSKGSLSGVDVARFDRANLDDMVATRLRSKLSIDGDYFVFSFIARKTRDKGAIDILRAFSVLSHSVNNVKLLFVGPDEDGEINRLREQDPGLFSNVIDVGQVNDHEAFLSVSDVLCLPSYREGFGSIVIDAAAMGVPTIGSRIPGLTDSIVDGQTGFLFAAGDLDGLVKHMRALASNPDMCRYLGQQAKSRVHRYFTADILYSALKEFYLRSAKDRVR